MAFPAISTTNSGATAASTSHTVNLPASIASGDLLLVMLTARATITFPAGWTQLTDTANTARLAIYYRIADGSEGASITVTTGSSVVTAYVSYRVTAWHGTTAPEVATAATGSSVNPNPPAVTPSWGSADNLFIAVAGTGGATWTSDPASYTLSSLHPTAGSGGSTVMAAVVGRQLTGSTDDPGTLTTDNKVWVAQTIVVRPTAGTTYDVAIAEAATAADAPSGAGTYPGALAEAATAADAISALATMLAAISEAATAADAPTAVFITSLLLSEAASALDASSAVFTTAQALAEALTATDSWSQGAVYALALAEAASALDDLSVLVSFAAALTEALSASDSPDAVLRAWELATSNGVAWVDGSPGTDAVWALVTRVAASWRNIHG